MGRRSNDNRSGTPTGQLRMKSLKVGYFKAKQLDYRSKAERLEIAASNESKVTQCSECGKPAVRRFHSAKLGHYGRCKKHLEGAVVPFSYRKAH